MATDAVPTAARQSPLPTTSVDHDNRDSRSGVAERGPEGDRIAGDGAYRRAGVGRRDAEDSDERPDTPGHALRPGAAAQHVNGVVDRRDGDDPSTSQAQHCPVDMDPVIGSPSCFGGQEAGSRAADTEPAMSQVLRRCGAEVVIATWIDEVAIGLIGWHSIPSAKQPISNQASPRRIVEPVAVRIRRDSRLVHLPGRSAVLMDSSGAREFALACRESRVCGGKFRRAITSRVRR